MEDEAQKMVALKKAYAEIILNTAKEAAARVMASEHKALRFQHDLRSSKDESLRVLLRLKQMIDSKTSEAEIASLSQQKRIEELEAQLQEAEDIITDLRLEVKQLWSELERINDRQVKPLDGQVTRIDASISDNPSPKGILLSHSGSGSETVPSSGLKKNILVNRGSDLKCCDEMKESNRLSISDLDKFSVPNSDLASIIMRTKEPELLRNGCTQRIRAFERNSLDEKLLPSGYVDNHNSHRKNELVIKASDKEEEKCNSPSFRDNNMEAVNNPSVEESKKPAKLKTIRRRKARFGKAKTSRQCYSSELMKSRQPTSVLSSCRTNSVNGNERSHEDACILPSMTIKKGKRKMKIRSKDGIATSITSTAKLIKPGQPSSILSRCRNFEYLGNGGGVKNCKDGTNTTQNVAEMKPLLRLDPGLTLARSDVDSISGPTSVTTSMKGISKSGDVQNAAGEATELILPESDAVENSGAPSSEFDVGADVSLRNSELKDMNISLMNSELKDVNVPFVTSESKDVKASEQSNVSANSVDNSKPLKYTFQRKRKSNSRNPGQTASIEENTAKRRMEEKEYTAQQPQLINDSSRDSRRLAQVARQLISLSGKKWC